MIWACQWCGHPRVVPAVNPVAYVCDKCGREAGGVFDMALPVPELTQEERELVDVRVTWSGAVPDNDTLHALRALEPKLRDQPLAAVVAELRARGYHSLGIDRRIDVRRLADDARARGLQVVLERVTTAPRRDVSDEEVVKMFEDHGRSWRDHFLLGDPPLVCSGGKDGLYGLIIEEDDLATAARSFLIARGARWFRDEEEFKAATGWNGEWRPPQ